MPIRLLSFTAGCASPVIFPIITESLPNSFSFNPVTNIKFNIPKSSFVKLIVYDVLGKEVTSLVNEELIQGEYSVDWNASDLPTGIYYYMIEKENFVESKRMVLLK